MSEVEFLPHDAASQGAGGSRPPGGSQPPGGPYPPGGAQLPAEPAAARPPRLPRLRAAAARAGAPLRPVAAALLGRLRPWRDDVVRSLRRLSARLVIGVVSLVLVLVGAISASTDVALHSFLMSRLDQQLNSAAGQNAAFIDHCIRSGSTQCIIGHGPPPTQREWLALLLPNSTEYPVNLSNSPFDTLTLPASVRKALTADPATVQTITSGADSVRVTGQQTDSGLVVVTGLSTDEVDRTMHRLISLEIIVGGAAVLLAVLATSYGVAFSLRRLRQVTDTAHEVAVELSPTGTGLDRRVDVPDDGSEVGQLAESMNTLLAAVETQFAARLESEARLRQFLADASHELRTPLTSIRGYAELARMQRAAGADTDDNLSRIESEGTRMSRLVEDLLTLARGDQGQQPARELVDVGELADDAASGTRAAFPHRQVEVVAAPDLHVIGDRDQLLRVLRNLLTNAAVHTAPERPIRVRATPEGDTAVLQVIDGGPGLPPEEAAHVFERFWRADKARSRARGGTGLGLAIVSAVVAAHGGTVRFDSSVEHGSTVTVRLPAVHG